MHMCNMCMCMCMCNMHMYMYMCMCMCMCNTCMCMCMYNMHMHKCMCMQDGHDRQRPAASALPPALYTTHMLLSHESQHAYANAAQECCGRAGPAGSVDGRSMSSTGRAVGRSVGSVSRVGSVGRSDDASTASRLSLATASSVAPGLHLQHVPPPCMTQSKTLERAGGKSQCSAAESASPAT